MNRTTTGNKAAGRLALPAIAAAVTFLVYLPSVRYGFVSFDDLRYVPGNPAIRHIDLAFIKLILTTVMASNWHPLTIFSYALDYAMWGAAPLGYHLENIVWHAVNTALVFVLTVRLFGVKGSPDAKTIFAGLTAALLFGLHPTHVESVSWISERKDVLSGFFFILSILAYLKYAAPSAGKKLLYYFASLSAFVLAVMSKPMAITLPVALLILDFYPLERFKDGVVKILTEKVPFLAVSLLTAALTLWAQSYGGAIKTFGTFPIDKRLFLSVRAPVFYLYKTVFPLKLSPIYLPPAKTSLAGFEFIASLAIVVAVTVFCLLAAKRNKIYLASWLFFLATLLPVIGIIQVGDQAAADRYTYLPGLGPFILVAAGAGAIFGRLSKGTGRTIAAACLVVVSGVLSLRTVSQEAIWKDSVTLWTHVIKTEGEIPLAYNSRGLVYQDLGEHKEAIADFNRAIELDPRYAFPYNNRGYSYQRMKDYGQAAKDYDRAIELDPGIASPYNNRGLLRYELGDYNNAVADFKKAIELDTKLLHAYVNMALAHTELGRFPEALKSYNDGLSLSPTEPDIYLNRGFLYLTLGAFGKAASDFESSIRFGQDDPSAYWGLGLASLKLGDTAKAEANIRKAAGMGSKEAKEFLEGSDSVHK
ncbi:MAG: tetratricopeptide repeat protein [Deltaproteobacteria bacterium]|nr:tetratricopeptide repeat protein [Deltaproteobacteria bacterium]